MPAMAKIVWSSCDRLRCASSTFAPAGQVTVTGTVAEPSGATVPSPAVAVTAAYAGAATTSIPAVTAAATMAFRIVPPLCGS